MNTNIFGPGLVNNFTSVNRAIDTVETMVRKRKLRWLGHVARMDPGCIPRQLLVCKFETGQIGTIRLPICQQDTYLNSH